MRCNVGSARRGPLAAVAATLLLLPASLEAQIGSGKLTGIVRDQATGQPLSGAQVFLEGTGLGTLTAENGRYFLLNLPAGTYTVAAQIIGYATLRKENVLISVDVTRSLDFDLPSEAIAVEAVVVQAERVPLIETNATGSRDVMTAEEIEALPVTDVSGVLSLMHGYLEPQYNTDVVSQLDTERGITPIRIRGGRNGETMTFVDGIPINNFLLGGAAIRPSTQIIEQTDYVRGGFEAKYGNALSGVIVHKTRDPRTVLQGGISYQTSALGGALGSDYDDLRDYHQVEGFVSGPIPGTANKLRFVVAGRGRQGASRTLQYDGMVYNPVTFVADELGNFGSNRDLIPGWRSLGFDNVQDGFGKLVYYFTPATKLSFTTIQYQRQINPFRFEWLQAGFDHYGQCVVLYPDLEDVCRRQYLNGIHPEKMVDLERTIAEDDYVVASTVKQNRELYALNWDHTLGRLAYNVAVGTFDQDRDSCAYVAGVCLGRRIAKTGSNGPFAIRRGQSNYGRHPIFGTSDVFGGDRADSRFLRADMEWQATDHHNVATGLFYQTHDIEFFEGRDVGLNQVQIEWNRYAGDPWDAALYVQDRIEYDFITIRFGLRFDYSRASGLFFSNPQNPTNGTTAFHVCENPSAFGLDASTFTYTDPSDGSVSTGITACALDRSLMDVAVAEAMKDDFEEAKPRRQLSPRLGISFPVTDGASIFFNYGRFTQNPLLHNLYRMTGIGTLTDNGEQVEGTGNALNFVANATRIPLLGNPHLLEEGTSSYELGYLTEIGENYGLALTLYNKDQYGLTGIRSGGIDEFGRVVFDPGSTYGATTSEYQVLLNLDFQTARGIEASLRRRLSNHWAFDLRYSYARYRTNAAPPELEAQKNEEDDPPARKEITSEIDEKHQFRGVLRLAVGREAPDIPFGAALRNTQLSFTASVGSGLPYTPQINLDGDIDGRLLRNSGTGPMRFDLNMLLRKNFQHRGIRYGGFLRVNNLLGRENCVQVFPSTGNCDGGQITRDRLRTGGVVSTGTISQAWDRPEYISAPRSFSAGLTIGF